jgi:hypothetical protein
MRATDWIGWAATALFLLSYSRKDQRRLRLMQAGAALLWVGYGAILHAVPIVVANLLVTAVAVYSSRSAPADSKPLPDVLKSAGEPDRSRISSPYS